MMIKNEIFIFIYRKIRIIIIDNNFRSKWFFFFFLLLPFFTYRRCWFALKKAAVSTHGQECAEIGVGMLNKGGSAVDAAIAALLCEGVASLHRWIKFSFFTHAHTFLYILIIFQYFLYTSTLFHAFVPLNRSMGLGGGFLMTIWDASNKTAVYLDAREVAPSDANETMFHGDPQLAMFGKNVNIFFFFYHTYAYTLKLIYVLGGLAVAVPGELLGYWEAHKKYGKLKWFDLFEPIISLCTTGSIVTKYLESYLSSKESSIRAEKSLAEILINPTTNSLWKVDVYVSCPLFFCLLYLAISIENAIEISFLSGRR